MQKGKREKRRIKRKRKEKKMKKKKKRRASEPEVSPVANTIEAGRSRQTKASGRVQQHDGTINERRGG